LLKLRILQEGLDPCRTLLKDGGHAGNPQLHDPLPRVLLEIKTAGDGVSVPLLRVQGLDYAYEKHKVLSKIDFSMHAGEMVCLAGANGSGKSTLLALLAGLYTPGGGHITLGDAASPGKTKTLRKKTALLLQDADMQILGADVAEDLLLVTDPKNTKDAEALQRAQGAAERFGLLEAWERPTHTLSYGQKRKLCLAAALLEAPELLLLDEPFAGLDYPACMEMLAFLKDCKASGPAVIVSTHDLDPVLDLADSLIVLDEGRIALSGRPEDVLDEIAAHKVRPPCSWLLERKLVPWE
jgi:biotin transport system ATP-binding protein